MPHITNGPGNTGPGLFRQGEQLLATPVKYTTAHTYSNDPASAFTLMMLGLGCPLEKIDMTKIASTSTQFAAWGMTYGYAHTRVRKGREIISQLLICANATIKRTDKILIEPINLTSVLTIDRERVTNTQGDEVGVDGAPTDLSSDTLEVPFFTNTVLLQQLARHFYRCQYWRAGQVGFPAAFDLAGLEPWDTITIQDPDIYGDALTCVLTSITIGLRHDDRGRGCSAHSGAAPGFCCAGADAMGCATDGGWAEDLLLV